MDRRNFLLLRLNSIAEGLSVPALTDAISALKEIENRSGLANKIQGKLGRAAIKYDEECDRDRRNPLEAELANKIRDYFSDEQN